VWVWDFGLETLRRLTTDPAPDQYPVWTPDGLRIVWSSFRDGRNGIFVANADGTGAVERLADSDVELSPNAMVPDGTGVIVRTFRTIGSNTDLFFVPLTGGGDVRPVVAATFNEQNASISPDGRWLAYQDNTSGRMQVTVRPYPDVDTGNWQVSTQGGRDPLWSRDGRELYYVNPDGTMMRVSVTLTPTFAHELPQPLFDASPYQPGIGRNFDIAPDGRFLMIKDEEVTREDEPELIVVLNWLEEVKARVKPR
jgi:serine/threonine-protein kinase